MEYYSFTAMNTQVLLAAQGNFRDLAAGYAQAEAKVHAEEERFTRFKATSELSALNRSDGRWFAASPELFEVVSLAVHYHHTTAGLFDPGVLADLEEAGYDRSLDEVRMRGDWAVHPAGEAGAIHRIAGLEPGAGPGARFSELELDAERSAIRLPAGLRIDLGGIAKGWIAERAAQVLSQYSSACAVEAGGDLYAWGRPEGSWEAAPPASVLGLAGRVGGGPETGGSWPVGLENPFDPAADLAVLWVGPGAVATSSVLKRRWKQASPAGPLERHHLIDPRTGLPAEAPWVSVTALAAHAARAEALAKAMLIAGPGGASELAARHPDSAFIAVDPQGKLWGSENSKEYLWQPQTVLQE